MLETLIRQVTAGLSVGAVLFLAAAGLNLIWGVLKIMNFATGAIYMIGAYAAHGILLDHGGTNLAFLAALVLVPLALAAAGAAFEVLFLRQTYRRNDGDQQFMLTLAASYILAGVVVSMFGVRQTAVDVPPFLAGHVGVLGTVVPKYTIFTLVASLALAAALWLLMNRTRLGLVTRAAVNDREMVSVLGVNVSVVYTITFAIGVGLGGMAGALIAPVSAVNPGLNQAILIPAFVVVVAGGLGRMSGALVAAMTIGLLTSFMALWASDYASLSPYLVLIIVLVARPIWSWYGANRPATVVA